MDVALPSTGAEARRLGISKYFTGKACARGHITHRYAHNGQCFGCAQDASRENGARRIRNGMARDYYAKRKVERPEEIMLMSAKYRAKKDGVPCTLTVADIKEVFPSDGLCPVLGIKMENNFSGKGSHQPSSPSLDKVNPSLGYVKGNIAIMSMHANKLKSDETDPTVFRKIADWIERNQ